LKEEIDELLDALNGGDELETVKEFADCFTLLIGIAGAKGWTAQKVLEVVAAKQEINKARKWGKPDENGVVKHIKT
jgi:NTP pyrophosphatase (non-canonical NTP hydrolase)